MRRPCKVSMAIDGVVLGFARVRVCSLPNLHNVRQRTDGLRLVWRARLKAVALRSDGQRKTRKQ